MSSTAPHQAIYRRWRAQTFGQIVGQQAVVETLRNGVRSGRTSHAYLFVGPRGTGKTSLARILAKALNCPNLHDGEPCDVCPSCVAIREGRALDVDEFDAASNNTVGDMRELLPRVFTAPSDLTRKVFIVDEVQRITQGWDVLLKTLEEPPDHVVFIFCTTDSSQIRPAVLSRVQRFDFRRLTVSEIAGKLRKILEGDGRAAEPEATELIARLAAGGMRDAESMLDQLLATDTGALTAERVREVLGLVEEETVEAFLDALVRGDAVAGIELLDGLEERGRDLRAFAEQAIERLRAALVASLGRGTPAGLAAAGPEALGAAARRLASIDPTHQGPGGLRLKLELTFLAPPEAQPGLRPSFAASMERAVSAARPSGSPRPPRRAGCGLSGADERRIDRREVSSDSIARSIAPAVGRATVSRAAADRRGAAGSGRAHATRSRGQTAARTSRNGLARAGDPGRVARPAARQGAPGPHAGAPPGAMGRGRRAHKQEPPD